MRCRMLFWKLNSINAHQVHFWALWPGLEHAFLLDVQELHERYYEPRAREAASLQEVLAGPPLKKLLFMTDPGVVDSMLRPFWTVPPLSAGPLPVWIKKSRNLCLSIHIC